MIYASNLIWQYGGSVLNSWSLMATRLDQGIADEKVGFHHPSVGYSKHRLVVNAGYSNQTQLFLLDHDNNLVQGAPVTGMMNMNRRYGPSAGVIGQ